MGNLSAVKLKSQVTVKSDRFREDWLSPIFLGSHTLPCRSGFAINSVHAHRICNPEIHIAFFEANDLLIMQKCFFLADYNSGNCYRVDCKYPRTEV